jgi:hypothetical protein
MDNEKKSVKTSILKAGSRTYFFDVNIASNSRRYLKITEASIKGEEKRRNSFILFPEDVQNFQNNLKEVSGYLAQ